MIIKRNQDKVILKDGKVSCSCCAQSCCMYPAQELFDGILPSNDLPDQIVFRWAEPGEPLIGTVINRSESRYETNVGTTNLLVEIAVNGSDVFWYRQISGPLFPSAPNGSSPCLIQGDGGLIPLNDFIEDQFAYTYTVSGPVSGTVTRFDLCTWRGDGLTLRYDGRLDANFLHVGTFKWRVNNNNKSGFQNTPAGSYAGGFTVA